MKSFKQFLKEADNRNEYPSITSETRRRLNFERMALGMPDIVYTPSKALSYPPLDPPLDEGEPLMDEPDDVYGPPAPEPEPSEEDRRQFRMQGKRQGQLISQIEKEREAEYPEQAEQLKKDLSSLDSYRRYLRQIQGLKGFENLEQQIQNRINTIADEISVNPTFKFAEDEDLIRKYPTDFSKEQIIGTEPRIIVAPSALEPQENKRILGRVVPSAENPHGMRNVTK